jgi:Ca2+-binding RTX toxin-like protein
MTAGALVLFGAAEGALAATVSVSSAHRLIFTAAPGEANVVTMGISGANVVVNDSGAPLTVGAGCAAAGTNQATCAGVTRITAALGDADDQFHNNTAIPSRVSGDGGNDIIHGGTGPDALLGEAGIDQLFGHEGDDTLNTRGGLADLADCGPGNDTLVYDSLDHVSTTCENTGPTPPPPGPGTAPPPPSGAPVIPPAPPGSKDPAGFSLPNGACPTRFLGTANGDRIDGTDQGDRMFGMAGDDVLNALGGDDCLLGMDGKDSLYGAGGADLLYGAAGRDFMSGGAGADRMWGEDGSDRMSGGSGHDRMSGGAGRDKMSGGRGNDRLLGGLGRDVLSGAKGNDRLKGGKGRNTYKGGPGRDTILARNGEADKINCGSGRDSARVDAIDVVTNCERVVRSG